MFSLTDTAGVHTLNEKKVFVTIEEKEVRKFDGESTEFSVKDFFHEIEALLRKEHDQEEKLYIVLSHLTGVALKEVKCCGRSLTSVEDIFQILDTAFGDRRPLSEILVAFAERQQTEVEDICSFSNDLFLRFEALKSKKEKLGCRASDPKLLTIHFVEGLKDKRLVWDLKRQLKEKDLAFCEVRESALEWEEIVGRQVESEVVGVDFVTDVDQAGRTQQQRKELFEKQRLLQM